MQTPGTNPRRGDLYWVDWNPARGSEQAGRRPAVVISNDRGNETAPTVVIAALTSRRSHRRYPFQVLIPPVPRTGLAEESTVLCHQLMTIAKERLESRIGALPSDLMARVDQALRVALGLERR